MNLFGEKQLKTSGQDKKKGINLAKGSARSLKFFFFQKKTLGQYRTTHTWKIDVTRLTKFKSSLVTTKKIIQLYSSNWLSTSVERERRRKKLSSPSLVSINSTLGGKEKNSNMIQKNIFERKKMEKRKVTFFSFFKDKINWMTRDARSCEHCESRRIEGSFNHFTRSFTCIQVEHFFPSLHFLSTKST